MRQAGNPDLVNLAAGLPSTERVPKADLKWAFDAALLEEADVALDLGMPHTGRRFSFEEKDRQPLFTSGIQLSGDELVITTGCTSRKHSDETSV